MTNRFRSPLVRRTVLTAALAIGALTGMSYGQTDTGTSAGGTRTTDVRHDDRGFDMGWLGLLGLLGLAGLKRRNVRHDERIHGSPVRA